MNFVLWFPDNFVRFHCTKRQAITMIQIIKAPKYRGKAKYLIMFSTHKWRRLAVVKLKFIKQNDLRNILSTF